MSTAEIAGKEYCQEWMNGPVDMMNPSKSQGINPHWKRTDEFYAWNYGFWQELYRVMLHSFISERREK